MLYGRSIRDWRIDIGESSTVGGVENQIDMSAIVKGAFRFGALHVHRGQRGGSKWGRVIGSTWLWINNSCLQIRNLCLKFWWPHLKLIEGRQNMQLFLHLQRNYSNKLLLLVLHWKTFSPVSSSLSFYWFTYLPPICHQLGNASIRPPFFSINPNSQSNGSKHCGRRKSKGSKDLGLARGLPGYKMSINSKKSIFWRYTKGKRLMEGTMKQQEGKKQYLW